MTGCSNFEKLLYLLSLVFFSFLMWNAFDVFPNKTYKLYQKQSFAIYVMHSNVEGVIAKLLFLIMPKVDSFAIVNYILTICLTASCVTAFASILEVRWKKGKIVLFGR